MQATAPKIEVTRQSEAVQPQPAPGRAWQGRPRWNSIGRLAPLILVLWVVADLGLRLLPPASLDIHPWQYARMGARGTAPFAPNVTLEATATVASAAITGNLPLMEEPVPIRFTTNSVGFRAVPGSVSGSPRLLTMAGSSFGYGYGLSDEHTFAAVLQRELRTPTFNAGRFFTDPDGLIELDHVLRQLPAKPDAVVYMYLEQQDLHLREADNPFPEFDPPPLKSLRKLGHQTVGPAAYRMFEENYYMVKRSFGTWLRLSPLEILATRWQKKLANDRILPNTHKNDVAIMSLTNGQRILFDSYEWRRAVQARSSERVAGTASYIAWLKDRLRDRGLDMYVVMVPDKASVYRDWLRGPADSVQALQTGNAAYLGDLESALAARGIVALNGLEVLRHTAAQDVSSGRLAYYLDDSHWNALGADRIGRATAAMIARQAAQSQE